MKATFTQATLPYQSLVKYIYPILLLLTLLTHEGYSQKLSRYSIKAKTGIGLLDGDLVQNNTTHITSLGATYSVLDEVIIGIDYTYGRFCADKRVDNNALLYRSKQNMIVAKGKLSLGNLLNTSENAPKLDVLMGGSIGLLHAKVNGKNETQFFANNQTTLITGFNLTISYRVVPGLSIIMEQEILGCKNDDIEGFSSPKNTKQSNDCLGLISIGVKIQPLKR